MTTFIYKYQMKDLSLCDRLIEYHKNSYEYKRPGSSGNSGKSGKLSTDVGVNIGSTDPSISEYQRHVYGTVTAYKKNYKYMNSPVELSEVFNIQHYKPNEGFFDYHTERTNIDNAKRALVFMTYLNDVTDGGETEFYYQKVKVKPKKGLTLIWPTDFTHTHHGITSPTQEKYIATGWFNFTSVETNKFVFERQLELLKSKEK